MANEISASSGLKVVNGESRLTVSTRTIQITQTTVGAGSFTQAVGTSEETITMGDLAPGVVELYNLDGTNYVQVGFSTGVYGARLYPTGSGIPMRFQLEPSGTIYVKANTAGCNVQVTAITL